MVLADPDVGRRLGDIGLEIPSPDKLAANYLAFIQLASIRLWLRINESTT